MSQLPHITLEAAKAHMDHRKPSFTILENSAGLQCGPQQWWCPSAMFEFATQVRLRC